jgi:hypothetical protein
MQVSSNINFLEKQVGDNEREYVTAVEEFEKERFALEVPYILSCA